MQGKSSIKIVILFILIFLILIGGFIMLKKIKHNKVVIDTDLREYIPASVSSVLQINKDKDVQALKNYTSILDSISLDISKNLTYPIYLLSNDSYYATLSRITSEQELLVKETIGKYYPAFAPKERIYKNATLLFYPIANNNFFCCLFYKGIFAYGYSSTFLEQIIDTKSNDNFFKTFSSPKLISTTSNLYNANLYYSKDDTCIVYNILSNKNNLDLEGYSNLFEKKQTEIQINDTTLYAINYSIFPNKPFSFSIKNKICLISNSITKYLILPQYTFYLTDQQDEPIHAVKLSGDRFILYNLLNDLENKFTGKRFNINDFAYGDQRIYTISEKLSKYIFQSENINYISFYNGYFIYSNNKKSLTLYLLNNGKFVIPYEDIEKELDINNDMNRGIEEVFYCQNINNNFGYTYTFNTIFNKSNIYLEGNLITENDNCKFNILLNKN